ncbi:MAG TPA: ASCH domain-containing protein [Candidatus Paceibacterota bacterium]|nr:ASCH domain-containing protein [Candidatus Paceibacterota bacterium]
MVLTFNQKNKDIFEKIKAGEKKVETRAATEKYQNIRAREEIIFVCGNSRFKKRVRKILKFKSIAGILKKYKPGDINPGITTAKEVIALYHSFPDYKEKIRKFGLIALELE